MKIIAFIEPSKFALLLDVNQFIKGFEIINDNQEISQLSDNTELVYLSEKEIKVAGYNEKLFNDASVVLVPDSFNLKHNFISEFKVLYHGITINNYSESILKLRKNNFFRGEKKSIEESTEDNEITPYFEIVELIKKGISNKGVKNIYDKIPSYNVLLEAKLNLLHECLTPEGAAEADTSSLTPEQKKIVLFLSKHKDNLAKDYIEKLTELRNSLLGS